MKLTLKDFKKFPVEIILVVVLVSLLYSCPYFIKRFVSNSLGKLVLIVSVIFITHFCGITSGVISALIVLLLLHNVFEGMENPKESESTSDEEENDDEDEDEDTNNDINDNSSTVTDSDNDTDEMELPQENDESNLENSESAIHTQSDLLDLNPGDLRNKKNGHDATPNIANNSNTEVNEPKPMPTDTKEGFALIN